MSSSNPDPSPDRTPGLDPGGSVPPGETPPAETSSTEGVSQREPELPSRRASVVVYSVVIGIAVVVAVMLGAYAAGLL